MNWLQVRAQMCRTLKQKGGEEAEVLSIKPKTHQSQNGELTFIYF